MTDENLDTFASPRPCHQPCFISDEEISATSGPGPYPGKCAPCVIDNDIQSTAPTQTRSSLRINNDDDLSVSASPRPCHQPCFVSDEELTKASFAPTCNHRPCFTSDEEISATSAPGSHPGKCAPCIIETETSYISNAAHAPVPRHAHISKNDDLNVADSRRQTSSDFHVNSNEDLLLNSIASPQCMHTLYSSITSDEEYL